VHLRELALALQARGEDVAVLAGGGGVLFEALAHGGVACRELRKLVHPIRPLKDLAAWMEIRQALKKLQPDLVSTHSNKAGLLGRLAARSLGIPVIHTSHGFLFSGRQHSASGRFFRLMEKVAAGAGDRVIAVSRSEYDLARRLKVVDDQKITFIHNGLPDFEPALVAGPAVQPPRLVMVARFAEPKDPVTLLQALGGLKDYRWSLELIGDGRGRGEAEKLVADLGLEDRITFRGWRDDVPQILARSSILVLSSRREGFPLSILEAMRAGLPVVASTVGGVGEAVLEGETGLLFPPGDVKALRNCLERLVSDAALREKMGKAGRKRFLKYFTLDQMVEKTVALYDEVLSGQR